MKAPGSPSSPLQTMYFTGSSMCRRTLSHLRPAGNPPPPRPRRPESEISLQIAAPSMSNSAFSKAMYPPLAMYSSRFSASLVPQLASTTRCCFL